MLEEESGGGNSDLDAYNARVSVRVCAYTFVCLCTHDLRIRMSFFKYFLSSQKTMS